MNKSTGPSDNFTNSIALLVDNPIIILDNRGKIEWANPAFYRLYGYKADQYSKNERDLGFISRLQETDSSFFNSHGSLSFSRPVIGKKGLRKWIQSTFTPVKNLNGIIERFIVIETDITQQKEVEEELLQRQENTLTLTEHIESVKGIVEEQIKELYDEKEALEQAKQKSDMVLSKVLPYEVAIQLKKKGFASPRHYKKVSVLNLNFRNFIELSETTDIEQLIEQLHECLVLFDQILEAHYVEKIKTNGGTYLGAGGVPLRNRSNPIDTALCAFEIISLTKIINNKRLNKNLPVFNIAIGIHTGNVIAGVVGNSKLSYDIWGDAVNLAAEVEKTANSGSIFISATTYHEIGGFFECEPTNKTIKHYKGNLNTYLLKRIKPEYSDNPAGTEPNEKFMQILSKL